MFCIFTKELKMIVIKLENVKSTVDTHLPELEQKLTVKYPKYWFSPKFKAGLWDGKIHFLNLKTGKFPTGLLHIVVEYLKEKKLEYQIIDNRKNPFLENVAVLDPKMLHGITLREDQLDAIRKCLECGRGVIHMPTGTGKAQPIDAKVYTPNGVVQLDSIKPRDIILTPKGEKTSVIAVFPQGQMPVYKITFSNNDTVECTEEHLWKVYSRVNKMKPKIMSLKNIIKKYKSINGRFTHQIALSEKLIFKKKNVLIYPYLMGILLGDGSLTQNSVRLSSADEEILEWIRNSLNTDYKLKHSGQYDYYIARKKRRRN